MTPARHTEIFLNMICQEVRVRILSNIADHYGITLEEAYLEITDPEAESLLDYVTGPERAATAALMRKYLIHIRYIGSRTENEKGD